MHASFVEQNTARTVSVSWPSPQDYNEAIQFPNTCFRDQELVAGKPYLGALGLPVAITGGFASVYKVRCKPGEFAIRCFLHHLPNQETRYEKISSFLRTRAFPFTVDCQYLPDGMQVNGSWYPIVKMPWLNGTTLDRFIERNRKHRPDLVAQLAEEFRHLCLQLEEAGVAHGDLQHGNLLVVDNHLVLIDYDAFYVPELHGLTSNELGHRNFQHPARSANDFSFTLDRFSAWIIYASLISVSIDPELWQKLSGGEECLLFRSTDFLQPEQSNTFYLLEHHKEPRIQELAKIVRTLLHKSISELPSLDAEKNIDTSTLPKLRPASPANHRIQAGQKGRSSLESRTPLQRHSTSVSSTIYVKPSAHQQTLPSMVAHKPRSMKKLRKVAPSGKPDTRLISVVSSIIGFMIFASACYATCCAQQSLVPTLEKAHKYQSNGDWHTAELLYGEYLVKNPLDHDAIVAQADCLFEQKMYKAAAQNYQKATKLSGHDGYSWYRFAKCLQTQANHKEAETAFRKAIFLGYKPAELQMAFASCLEQQGKTKEAIGLVKKVVATLPNDEQAWLLLTRLYNKTGDTRALHSAQLSYYQAVKTNNNNRLFYSLFIATLIIIRIAFSLKR